MHGPCLTQVLGLGGSSRLCHPWDAVPGLLQLLSHFAKPKPLPELGGDPGVLICFLLFLLNSSLHRCRIAWQSVSAPGRLQEAWGSCGLGCRDLPR